MNFSAWNWATHFRLHEAACLIAGVMPVSKKHPTSEELPPQARPILVKLMSAYYEWVLQQHKPGRPKALCLEGSLNLDGTPPLPGLKELPSELVSREAIRRFLSEMQDSGHASVYDFGPPTQATPIAAQYKDDGLIVQSALDRLDKAKKALVRREALLASPERPGGLAEQEALEVAVPTLKKEVAKAQQIVCTLRGDFLEKQQNTDFAVAFYSACLDLYHWTGLTAVQPLEAAMLLNNENPLSKLAHSGSVEIQKLLRVFEDHSAIQPARRTLLDWVQVAQERKAKHDSTVAEAVLAIAGASGVVEKTTPKTIEQTGQPASHPSFGFELDTIDETSKSPELTAPDTSLSKGTPSKLSDQDKAEIVRLHGRGRGMKVLPLAIKFEVSRPTIDKVLRRAGVKN